MKTLLDKPVLFKDPDYGKKVVIWDIETSYIVSATWGVHETDVAKILREPFIIGIGWKYLNGKEVYYKDITDFPLYKKDKFNDKALIEYFRGVIDKGDVFVAHNGNKFDWRWLNGRFAVHNMEPPNPKKLVDTLLVCRQKFNFPDYSLKALAERFKIGRKLSNDGIDLWIDCIENSIPKRWKEMEEYCKGDVVVLEKLYKKIRPYITNHPNMNLIMGGIFNCPRCGGQNTQKAGFDYTSVGTYQTYRCLNCGARPRGERVQVEKPVLK